MTATLHSATHNWKTTLFGILTLAFTAFQIWNQPAKATDPETLAQLAAGITGIVAQDGRKETPETRQ